ncbi:MAG: nuclear transport factor 2 family protein [Nocardioides sp.]|uniref:nuclear transport factor 2 family protein n=1 Tax=Nocardioides sp. TaxID=35761 RepID=UPI003EFBBCEA
MALSIDERRAKVEQYMDLIGNGTAAQIMEMYGPDPVLEDPVGTEPKRGREEVGAFYATFEAMETAAELREFHAAGDSAAFAFDVITKVGESNARISVIEVMHFNDDGLIRHMQAYWSPEVDMTLE